jgi:hypothetical protein
MTKKFLLRWMAILFIFIIYYIVFFFFHFIFQLDFSENMSMGGGFTAAQCHAIARELLSDHDNTMIVSLVGFLASVAFILLAFKKIR